MIYFSDNFNFKKQNFPELFDVIDEFGISAKYDGHDSVLKKSWGVYNGSEITLQKSFEEMKQEQYKGFSLFDISKHEILSACSTTERWKGIVNHNGDKFWDQIVYEFPEFFSGCYNAAKYWVDYWLSINLNKVSAGINFGGSLIYARAFAEVLKRRNVPVFCLEHFFTGNEFYFEKKYDSLPNNSIIKDDSFIASLAKRNSLFNGKSYIQKINHAKNKNVTQPAYARPIENIDCLLLCQVLNDFSILSDINKFKNSTVFYKSFISEYLSSSKGVLAIKTHPYESQKIPEGVSTTHDELQKFVLSLPEEEQSRVLFYQQVSLPGLIDACNYSVLLNSQSGLEVLMRGKPLVCFGNPFYGKKGFTYDYSSVEEFFNDKLELDLDHNKAILLSLYLKNVFSVLVGAGESVKIHKELSNIGIKFRAVGKSKARADTLKSNHISSNFVRKGLNKPLSSFRKFEKDVLLSKKSYRLLRKLLRDPKQYLADSKNPLLKKISARVHK